MNTLHTLLATARPALFWAACRLRPAKRVILSLAPRMLAGALASLMLATTLVAPVSAAIRHNGVTEIADGRLVDVSILVEGRTAPLFIGPGGLQRHYFQAFKGRNYALQITNTTGRRIGVLIAVDGLNVVNGERSRLASGEPMYVLDPWETTVIKGWRSSLRDVRKFVFVDEERSYAERTGQANGDMGWIRLLAFHERGVRYRDDRGGRINGREPFENEPFGSREEGEARRNATPPMAQGAPEAQDGVQPRTWGDTKSMYRDSDPNSAPGTGWGQQSWDPVRRVWFVPAFNATDHLVFRYEYLAGLRALGIDPRDRGWRVWERERGELGFAQPPRW